MYAREIYKLYWTDSLRGTANFYSTSTGVRRLYSLVCTLLVIVLDS